MATDDQDAVMNSVPDSSKAHRRDGHRSKAEIIEEMRSNMINPYGPACADILTNFLTPIYLAVVAAVIVHVISFHPMGLAGIIIIGSFVVTRHFQVVKRKDRQFVDRHLVTANNKHPGPDITKLPAVYFLYVFGSGGHSTEMSMLIKNMLRGSANMHRRYVMGSQDTYSWEQKQKIEAKIHEAYDAETAGTCDTIGVTRARDIGQSYITSFFTSLKCAFDVTVALTARPEARPEKKYQDFYNFPHVIITNGPGSGFIVCLVAHLLKIFYLVPQTHLKIVYVESLARVENLSLTGKLFYWTDLADLFLVQSDKLAKKIGKQSIGLVGIRSGPSGVKRARSRVKEGQVKKDNQAKKMDQSDK